MFGFLKKRDPEAEARVARAKRVRDAMLPLYAASVRHKTATGDLDARMAQRALRNAYQGADFFVKVTDEMIETAERGEGPAREEVVESIDCQTHVITEKER